LPLIDDYLLGRSPQFPLAPTGENRTDLALSHSASPVGRVRGRVTSFVGGQGLGGVTVKIRTQSGDPVAHTTTNPGGNYQIEDIAPGTYTIDVALLGFVTPSGQTFSISSGQTLDINFVMTPEAHALNVVYGVISNQSTGELIFEALVAIIQAPMDLTNVRGQHSNSSGQYLCGDLPNGTYIASVSKPGFKDTNTVPFTISGGTILRLDIELQPETVPQATVNGYIKTQGGTPIANACVGLYALALGGLETLQQVTYSDSSGFYLFGRVGAGEYVVKAKSEKEVQEIP